MLPKEYYTSEVSNYSPAWMTSERYEYCEIDNPSENAFFKSISTFFKHMFA